MINEESLKEWEQKHIKLLTSREMGEWLYRRDMNARPQGEWIGNAFDEHHCNRCGHPALWEEEPDGYYEVQSRFCPHCGADMRGKEE